MGPKKGTKQAADMAQPTLSFQSRKSSAPSPAKKKARTSSAAAAAPAVAPSTPPKRRSTRGRSTTPTLVPASSDEGEAATEGESDDDFTELRTPAGPSTAHGAAHDDPFIVTSSPIARGPATPAKARARPTNMVAKPPLELSTAIPASTESRAPSPTAIQQTTKGKVEEKRKLDVKSKEVRALMRDAKVAMGNLEPIHAGPATHNDVHHVLRVFDMTSAYGPCVGMTRLQRWERAKKWGLNPPEEIRNILTTVEGQRDVAYRENVLHEWV